MALAHIPPLPESEEVRIRLRAYRPQDFDALWLLDQQCFDEEAYSRIELAHYMSRRNAFTVVAECDAKPSRICGFIVAHRRAAIGHILTIDVEPQSRRHRIGSRLLIAAHHRLAREGCNTIYLETAVNNLPAIAFYKRHDYSVVRTLPRYYYTSGMDAFLMSAHLPLPAQPQQG